MPGREVGVLDSPRYRERDTLCFERCIKGQQLAREDTHGPAVPDQVVHGQQEHHLGYAQPQHGRTQQRSDFQVEGLSGFPCGQLRRPLLAHRRREICQVDRRQGDCHARKNPLVGLPLDRFDDGAQHLVAAHNLFEAALQST